MNHLRMLAEEKLEDLDRHLTRLEAGISEHEKALTSLRARFQEVFDLKQQIKKELSALPLPWQASA